LPLSYSSVGEAHLGLDLRCVCENTIMAASPPKYYVYDLFYAIGLGSALQAAYTKPSTGVIIYLTALICVLLWAWDDR
jgi:hypothetical protein